MKKTISRVLALTLALIMLLGAIPMVSAAETSCEDGIHEFTVSKTVKATCSKEGSQTLKCKHCGFTITKTLPKLEHTVTWTYPADASCESEFTATGTCSVCRTKNLTMKVAAGTHLVSSWAHPKNYDCTADKLPLEGKCLLCDTKVTKQIDNPEKDATKREHAWGEWKYPETAFICGDGAKRSHTCSDCNTTAYEVIKAHTLIASTIEKPADAKCDVGFTQYGDCSVCGAKRVNVTVEAKDCVVTKWNYPKTVANWNITDGATGYSCTAKDNNGTNLPFQMVGKCTNCGQECKTAPLPTEIRGKHDVSTWTMVEGEDCTNPTHKMIGTCKECGYAVIRTAEKSEVCDKHNIPNPVSVSGTVDCTLGYTVAGYCTVCKTNRTNTVAPGTEHKLGEYKQTKAPTCVMDGEEEAICSVCETKVKRAVAADGKTHKFGIDGKCINTNEDGTMQCVADRGAYPTVNSLTVQVSKTAPVDVDWTNASASVSYNNFKSANTAIATVDSKGNVKGIAPGIVEITFNAKYGNENIEGLKCMVTVVSSVGINCSSTSMKYASGASVKLNPALTSAVADVVWTASNSDTSVADVSINSTTGACEVKAKDVGYTKITLSAKYKNNGKDFTATEDVYVSFYKDSQATLTVDGDVGAFYFDDRGVFSKIVVDGKAVSNLSNRSLINTLAGAASGYQLQQNEANSVVGKITGSGWDATKLCNFDDISNLQFVCMANGEFDLSYKVLGNEGITVDQGVITFVVNSSDSITYDVAKGKNLTLSAADFTQYWTKKGYSGTPSSLEILKSVSVGGLYYNKSLTEKVTAGDQFYFSGTAAQLGDVVYAPKNQTKDYTDEFTFILKNGSQELYGTVKLDVSEKLPFTDVKKTDWYYDSLVSAYKNDLINGVTATQFKPNSNLTVAQAIKLAAALHQMDNDGEVTLKNGSGSTWYSTYVKYAVDNKIIEAKYANYTLAQMNKTATRSEFVHIFFGAMDNYTTINTVADNAIPDVKLNSTANAGEIYTFYRAGILTGSDSKGTFNPNSNIKRSEVAAILIRMYDTAQRQSISLS